MAGIQNNIVTSSGERLSPSLAQDIVDMQEAATDVSRINYTGNPEGNVSANPSSICHDPVSGNFYVKTSGTGNTGWTRLVPMGALTGIVAGNGTTYFGRTLTNGGGLSITNADGSAGNPTLQVIGGGYNWQNITASSQTFFTRNAYLANNNSVRIDFNLGGISFGDCWRIVGYGSGGWRLNANGGSKTIRIGNQVCTTGTGYIESTNQYDCIEVCAATNGNDVLVISSIGNINVV